MYAEVVIGEDVVLDIDNPMIVVCVEAGHVYTVAADVPTFLDGYDLNVLVAMFYPNAIAIAIAVPAGST